MYAILHHSNRKWRKQVIVNTEYIILVVLIDFGDIRMICMINLRFKQCPMDPLMSIT